jgi:hypothetical protein
VLYCRTLARVMEINSDSIPLYSVSHTLGTLDDGHMGLSLSRLVIMPHTQDEITQARKITLEAPLEAPWHHLGTKLHSSCTWTWPLEAYDITIYPLTSPFGLGFDGWCGSR